MKKTFIILVYVLIGFALQAQPVQTLVTVSVVPRSDDWTYKTGDKAYFDVEIKQSGKLVKNVDVSYELSFDMLSPFEKKAVNSKDGKLAINAGTMKTPGFLRCRVVASVNGVNYSGMATAGFSPESIVPTTNMPVDFQEFWDGEKEKNSKIPMNTKMVLLPERCTEKVNVYEVSIQNMTRENRVYGILCVPKAPGKYPALLRVPGAGIRPYKGDVKTAERGFILFEMGIHGIPVTLDQSVYDNLSNGPLNRYRTMNWTNRDDVYYKRVYMGCVRSVDFIYSLPEFDQKNLIVHGGSQGGALAIVTAALDDRITAAYSFYPALADMNGYLYNRAGGWPHFFKDSKDKDEPCLLKEKENAAQYYDVVNFARLVKVPVFFAFGFNDMVCPPTTCYAVYNSLKPVSTTLHIIPEIGHYTYPELYTAAWKWVDDVVGLNKK